MPAIHTRLIVLVDDGHGADDLLHLVVRSRLPKRVIKTREYEILLVPGVNNLGRYGRWAFAELREVYRMEADFEAKVDAEFGKMIDAITAQATSEVR